MRTFAAARARRVARARGERSVLSGLPRPADLAVPRPSRRRGRRGRSGRRRGTRGRAGSPGDAGAGHGAPPAQGAAAGFALPARRGVPVGPAHGRTLGALGPGPGRTRWFWRSGRQGGPGRPRGEAGRILVRASPEAEPYLQRLWFAGYGSRPGRAGHGGTEGPVGDAIEPARRYFFPPDGPKLCGVRGGLGIQRLGSPIHDARVELRVEPPWPRLGEGSSRSGLEGSRRSAPVLGTSMSINEALPG